MSLRKKKKSTTVHFCLVSGKIKKEKKSQIYKFETTSGWGGGGVKGLETSQHQRNILIRGANENTDLQNARKESKWMSLRINRVRKMNSITLRIGQSILLRKGQTRIYADNYES